MDRSTSVKVVVFGLLVYQALSYQACSDKSYNGGTIFRTYDEGSALLGYVNDTFSVMTLLECQFHCVKRNPKCKSFNFKEKSGIYSCEVSTAKKESAPVGNFVKDDTSTYVEVITEEEKAFEAFSDGPWALIARFSNNDEKNWMTPQGTWWYDRNEPFGETLDASHNGDMIAGDFWLHKGSEFRITRSDDPTHTALLTTTGNCLNGMTFRCKMASFGIFRGSTIWASNECLGRCSVVYGPNVTLTEGFRQATCEGNMQSSQKIGFWCDYGAGDGAVLMIGGGGTCARADHGIGITEANSANFAENIGKFDFGNEAASTPLQSYSLNLWIR